MKTLVINDHVLCFCVGPYGHLLAEEILVDGEDQYTELFGKISIPWREFDELPFHVIRALRNSDHFVIKTYSENASWVPALLEAGVFEDTGNKIQRRFPTHKVDFPIWKLTSFGKELFNAS